MPRCSRCFRRLSAGSACPDDGTLAPASAPISEHEPPTLTDYVVGDVIGAGGFSIVYAGTAMRGGQPVAIKVAREASPVVQARFEREAAALCELAPPFVPGFVESGQLADGRPFLVMERLTAPTLADVLASTAAVMPLATCLRIADAIATALVAAHARGLVHRDIKPENVVIRPEGDACLLDFGLVGVIDRPLDDARLTRTGTVVGSVEYMAPEQIRGGRVGAAADIYAFGVMLFELVTLRIPFAGDRPTVEHGHLSLRPPLPSRLRPMPAALETLILDLLAKAPERRPTDLEAVRVQLSKLIGEDNRAPAPSGQNTVLATEGQRPVTLVHVGGALPLDQLRDLAARFGATIVRHRGADALVAVLPSAQTDPLSAAVALAREAVAHPGAHAVVHLGLALVRSSARGGVALYGRDVDKPTWLPRAPWHGALVTRAAADALGLADDDGSEFVAASGPIVAPEATAASSLVGRQRAAEHAVDVVRRAIRDRAPALCVVVGDEGMGKSTFAAHIAATAVHELRDVDVLRLAVRRPFATDAEQSLHQLLRALLGVDRVHVPRDPLALVAERLGNDVATTAGRGVLVALGWHDGVDASPRPEAIRDELRRAVASGLLHRASLRPVLVVVDDAQLADDATLEILEHACDTVKLPLGILLTCTSRFADARRAWGRRGRRVETVVLQPLAESDATVLAAQLLPAGTRVPAQVVARLASWSGGNPAVLVDLIGLLRREKIVRRHEGTNAWFIAADELDRLPPLPAAQWLASRELDSLAPELADLARVAAVLGLDFSIEELEAVQRVLQRAGFDRAMADAAAGLAQLVRERLLVGRSDGRFAFRRPSQREALFALVPDAIRTAIHEAAFRHWDSLSDSVNDRRARAAYHAAGSGHRDEARVHYSALAARAKARHDYVDAERMLTAALAHCEASDRFALLEERGAVRRFLTHYEEARADLTAARALAEKISDRV
ncbi:MAG TPA: protein kinase, partial [Kofleriaceae bacterium]